MEWLWATWSSLVYKTVKNLPATHKTWVQSMGQEDPLEKGMATQSSVLAWRIPWQRSLEGYCPWGCKELDTTERLLLSHGPPIFSLKIPQCFLIKESQCHSWVTTVICSMASLDWHFAFQSIRRSSVKLLFVNTVLMRYILISLLLPEQYWLETYQYVFRQWYNERHQVKLLELNIDQGFIIQIMIVIIFHILLH